MAAGTRLRYQLHIVNDAPAATGPQCFCVYQEAPEGAESLAWWVVPALPNTTMVLAWSDDYCFGWAGTDRPGGATVDHQQVWPVDLTGLTARQVLLDHDADAYLFVRAPAVPDPRPDTLYLGVKRVAHGDPPRVTLGRSGRPLFAVRPGAGAVYAFTPHELGGYRVVAADPGEIAQGEPLRLADDGRDHAEVSFAAGPESTATFDGTTWAVTPGPPPRPQYPPQKPTRAPGAGERGET